MEYGEEYYNMNYKLDKQNKEKILYMQKIIHRNIYIEISNYLYLYKKNIIYNLFQI